MTHRFNFKNRIEIDDFIDFANQCNGDIYAYAENNPHRKINCKSIIGFLSLAPRTNPIIIEIQDQKDEIIFLKTYRR